MGQYEVWWLLPRGQMKEVAHGATWGADKEAVWSPGSEECLGHCSCVSSADADEAGITEQLS